MTRESSFGMLWATEGGFFMSKNEMKTKLKEQLTKNLPPIIARCKIGFYMGELLSESYLANLDSLGVGPPKVKFGRKVGYLRDDLIDWLLDRYEE